MTDKDYNMNYDGSSDSDATSKHTVKRIIEKTENPGEILVTTVTDLNNSATKSDTSTFVMEGCTCLQGSGGSGPEIHPAGGGGCKGPATVLNESFGTIHKCEACGECAKAEKEGRKLNEPEDHPTEKFPSSTFFEPYDPNK